MKISNIVMVGENRWELYINNQRWIYTSHPERFITEDSYVKYKFLPYTRLYNLSTSNEITINKYIAFDEQRAHQIIEQLFKIDLLQ